MEITSTIDFKHPLRWLLSPTCQVFISIGFVALGVMASFWSKEITTIRFDLDAPINWPAVIFWGLFIIVAVMFALAAHVRAQSTRFYISLIRTSPSVKVLEMFENRVREAMDLNEAIISLPDVDKDSAEEFAIEIEKNIRRVLDACVSLVKELDDSNGGNSCVYRANIMQVVNFSEDDVPDEKQQWLHHFGQRFIHTMIATRLKEDYSGFVYLENNALTTTTQTKEPDPDTSAKPLALPFTLEEEQDRRDSEYGYPNLPGAPYAVANARMNIIKSVSNLETSLNEWRHKDEKMIEDILRYYKGNTLAKSIISMPLTVTDTDGNNVVIACLNIYRDRTGILFDGAKSYECQRLLAPFLLILSRMLQCLRNIDLQRDKQWELGDNEHVRKVTK